MGQGAKKQRPFPDGYVPQHGVLEVGSGLSPREMRHIRAQNIN